ncbi:MAG TPA: DinB family protein [Gemmatimonadaceae bacterium]|nr:DinB family protein [Gemmatimonadaceae bacterium]
MPRLRWFDRKFDYAFPVELHREILERLRGTPGRLTERTAGLSRDVLTRRPGQAWSIQEHVGHIADLDDGIFFTRLAAYRNGDPMLPAADLTNAGTDAANHNDRSIGGVLESARHARARFVAELESFDDAMFARTSTHPRLGTPMRLVDMMFFVAEHDDHHLATITELARGAAR